MKLTENWYNKQIIHDIAITTTSAACQEAIYHRSSSNSDPMAISCLCANHNLDPHLLSIMYTRNWDLKPIGWINQSKINDLFQEKVEYQRSGKTGPNITYIRPLTPEEAEQQESQGIKQYSLLLYEVVNSVPALLDSLGPQAWIAFFEMMYNWEGTPTTLAQTVQTLFA